MCDSNDSDDLDFGGDSEDNGVDSSEDELDIILHCSPGQRQRLQPPPACQDSFEQEMNAEIQDTVSAIEEQREKSSAKTDTSDPCSSVSGNSSSAQPTQFYDDIYFDSDDDVDDKESSKHMMKRRIPTNDDLLYDPNMDDDDERWVARQRRSCRPRSQTQVIPQSDPPAALPRSDPPETLPRSDAVLDCPACMTTLCRDCQRHVKYENQYQAMFVTSCVVDRTEVLKFPEKKNGRRRKKGVDVATSESEDRYHPVMCAECNTVVAMYDSDEVYHFFNVLASY